MLSLVIYCVLTVPLLFYIIFEGLWTNVVEIIPWIGYVWFSTKVTNVIYLWIYQKIKR